LLVEHCADVARQRASRILHVVGNPHAKGFYAACGFLTTGAVETRFGAGLAMERCALTKPALNKRRGSLPWHPPSAIK